MYLDFRVDFPSDPRTQLEMAIAAVFSSWNNPRAVTYRELNRIVGLKGTAVNVQARHPVAYIFSIRLLLSPRWSVSRFDREATPFN